MRTLVIYDSLYGNTESIARAIGAALPGHVPVVHVSQADASAWADADLLIVGSPTHGALPTQAVQDLIDRIGPPARDGALVATFDTRLTWKFLERWGGFAAPKMADALQARGWTVVGGPGGFFVRGLRKGPLKRGQVERAVAWAKGIVEGIEIA